MGSFAIWHWIIVLAIVAGIFWLVMRARKMAPSAPSKLEGIGGWLALLAFGQIMGLLRLVVTVFQNFQTYGPVIDVPGAKVAIFTEVLMNFGLIALAVATTIFLFMKKRAFVKFFTYQWLALPVVFVLNLVIVSAALGLSTSDLVTSEDIRTSVATFIAGGIWVWYTRASVRVAGTMVN